jgi:hypothetical protein
MKRFIAAFLSLMFASASALAGLTCADLKYGSDGYQEHMEELAKQARLTDGYYTRYHEDAVRYICSGNKKEVAKLVDDGYVKASEVEGIKEAIGKSKRSEAGQSYGYSRQKFSEMGLCNACADNVAQYYTKQPASPCGKLAKRALEGNPQALEELQSFPAYCQWKY